MKNYLFPLLFSIIVNSTIAETHPKDSASHLPRNQFDFGVNGSYYFDRFNFMLDNGIEDWRRIDLGNKPFRVFNRFHYSYKRFISPKYCVELSYQHFEFGGILFDFNWKDEPSTRGQLEWRDGYKMYSMGGSYVLGYKYMKTLLGFGLTYLQSDLYGNRDIFWAYTPNEGLAPWEQHMPTYLSYNDQNAIGLSGKVDFNWFFYKNLGIGSNLLLSYFPFRKSLFAGDDYWFKWTDYPTPADKEKFIKPAKTILACNIKLVYRFNDLKFIKRTKD